MLCFLSGCHEAQIPASSQRNKGLSHRDIPDILDLSVGLSTARNLEEREKYKDALVCYRRVKNDSAKSTEVEMASLGSARCLIRMEKYPAAMSELLPLPEIAEDNNQRQQLALAGQILLLQKDTTRAIELLNRAVHGVRDDPYQKPDNWLAAAYANLASALLNDDQISKASVMFKRAAETYHNIGNIKSSARCSQMAISIDKILTSS